MNDAAFAIVLASTVVIGIAVLLWLNRSSRQSTPPSDDEPVAITDGAEIEMEILKSRLAAEGLTSFIKNRGGVYPYRSPLYGWELCVRYADVAETRRLLRLDDGESENA